MTNRRSPGGAAGRALTLLLIIGSLFHIYTGGFGLLSTMSQRSLHLLFMLTPVFFLYSATVKGAKKLPWYDIAIGCLVMASCLYLFFTWPRQTMRIGDPGILDLFFGAVLILGVLEGARRTAGNALAGIAGLMVLYCCFGKYLPGSLAHRGYSLSRIISFFSSTAEGIFGVPLGVSASLIVLFVIFGGVLNATGGGQFFIDATFSMAGRLRGGTAKTAVVASALMGMISGSPIANVVTTGTFTIPLMKRGGFSSNLSAAICAMASAGGILMPPVMGAAAFIMAEYLGMSYGEVIMAAIIPSVLFYGSIFVIVDLEAVKLGLKGESQEDLPNLGKVMRAGWHLLIPIAALVWFLMLKWSAAKAVFWSIVLLVAVSFFRTHTRLNKEKVVKAMVDGAKESVPIAVACAAAGLIVGTLALTGLGVKFSSSIIALSGGSKIVALIMAMVASLILGMGMPATAVYILSASLLAPPLINLGIAPVAAHFFIFYFSVISCITPPVALTAYAAAGLAACDPNKAGWPAFYYGILAYIIPFIFVYDPVLLWQGGGLGIFLAFTTALVGIFGIGVALEGYLAGPVKAIVRLAFFASGILALIPNMLLSLFGIGTMAALVYWEKRRSARDVSFSGAGRDTVADEAGVSVHGVSEGTGSVTGISSAGLTDVSIEFPTVAMDNTEGGEAFSGRKM